MEERKLKLHEKIRSLKKQIETNSKDAHFAKVLVDELLSAKAQLCIEPIELNVGKKIDELKGKTFTIVKTDRGCLYHEYGGYSVFVKPGMSALYDTLVDYVENKSTYSKLEGEEKELFDLNLSAITYCLSVPKFCYEDMEFTYDIAKMVIQHLRKKYEKAMEAPLQDETIEEDEQFKQAILGLENIKEEIKNIEKEKE